MKPTNQPDRYDPARVARARPIETMVEQLRLPLNRHRKVLSILSALQIQIEDGGDSPTVNEHLLAALREAVLHQVSPDQAAAVLTAVDTFAEQERLRWHQIATQTLPPIEVPPEERMGDLVFEGYQFQTAHRAADACDHWLAAWEIAKTLMTSAMHSTQDFDAAYSSRLDPVRAWCLELMYELHNAGLDDAAYATRRLVFVQEFLARFDAEDAHTQCEFLRGQGEALWRLGRKAEAEMVYANAIAQFPDAAWLYIGWADHYWLWEKDRKNFARGEEILRRALARDTIDDRQDVLDRLHDLHETWARPQDATTVKRTNNAPLLAVSAHVPGSDSSAAVNAQAPPTPISSHLRRNDPCWCGSGKKYKHCHLKTDRR